VSCRHRRGKIPVMALLTITGYGRRIEVDLILTVNIDCDEMALRVDQEKNMRTKKHKEIKSINMRCNHVIATERM
jgi:hypothetical protein